MNKDSSVRERHVQLKQSVSHLHGAHHFLFALEEERLECVNHMRAASTKAPTMAEAAGPLGGLRGARARALPPPLTPYTALMEATKS